MVYRVIWVQVDCFPEFGDSPINVPFHGQDEPEARVLIGVIRLETNRLAILSDSAVQIALLEQKTRKQRVRTRVARVGPGSLSGHCYGAILALA